MAVNRRLLVLGGTLIVLIVVVVVMRSSPNPPASAAARPRPASERGAVATDTAPPADVQLEALARERGEPIEAGRNPFRFRPKPVPPPPPPVAPPRPTTPEGQAGGTLSPVPAGPPPPPPITLKFIGVVEKPDGTRIAVLTDGKGPPISGREGQEIEGRYKILKIGNESLDIAYIDGRGRTQLRLSGQ